MRKEFCCDPDWNPDPVQYFYLKEQYFLTNTVIYISHESIHPDQNGSRLELNVFSCKYFYGLSFKGDAKEILHYVVLRIEFWSNSKIVFNF